MAEPTPASYHAGSVNTHGTWSCYVKRRCRCDVCRLAASERNRAYRLANRDRIIARSRKRNAENREKLRDEARDRYRADPEAGAARVRAHRAAHPGLDAAQQRARREADPGRARGHKATRRAREMAAYREFVNSSVVFERDGGVCQICGQEIGGAVWHVDHVVPLSRGGLHCYANVQLAHGSCNQRKAARMP